MPRFCPRAFNLPSVCKVHCSDTHESPYSHKAPSSLPSNSTSPLLLSVEFINAQHCISHLTVYWLSLQLESSSETKGFCLCCSPAAGTVSDTQKALSNTCWWIKEDANRLKFVLTKGLSFSGNQEVPPPLLVLFFPLTKFLTHHPWPGKRAEKGNQASEREGSTFFQIVIFLEPALTWGFGTP